MTEELTAAAAAPTDDESAGAVADDHDGLFPAPAPAPPHTGDAIVDRALADLNQALGRDLDDQIAVADTVGEALHARLQDLDSE